VVFCVGTLNPAPFASLAPMAMACILLFTLPFLPDLKVSSVSFRHLI
jgi:hypothetical protein